ncbi:PilZ domain-containing protein [Roseateles oligotrophus]|uniref:PilZ domain-containing protein n=1 Tax=Roseateles oligotrophus TaxID=1769250 RepID=A0ABT2YFM7_9BURK|nr:PilZ domain-containing protein [Roseateles oligotrophus]MCV2368865.1 PilZ domain-containing protein [Roseateles oligotrophus]
MKIGNPIRCLRQLWRSQAEPQAHIPADELMLRDARQIGQLLSAISRSRRQVVLQSKDGRLMATGDLQTYGEHGLAVRVHEDCLLSAVTFSEAALARVNISAASESGVLLFSLHGARIIGNWLVAANLPTELLRMQSRRHFRLCGKGSMGLLQHASISCQGLTEKLALRDLSEEGAGLLLKAKEWQGPTDLKQVRLHLGQDDLPIPLLQVVHKRLLTVAAGNCCTVGARLIGIQPEHIRSLRRWLLATQAEMGLPRLE